MLILTRRANESLIINDNITVTVLGIRGNQVRIGIDAPKDVDIHREEIYERIKSEKELMTFCARPGESWREKHNPLL